ncbi:MAG: Hsp70 family protein [Treponema sp.]|jgi:molecular chaperone DnaK (HSP70)|nr:Hsp70 family protein [Treponema sp.]
MRADEKMDTEDHDDLCVGIDLGTTNSVLSIINLTPSGSIVNKVVDISRYDDVYTTAAHTDGFKGSTVKRPLLPSYVYYREDRRGELKPLVGDFAKRQYTLRPQFVARSIKSQMGQTKVSGLSPDVPDKTPEAISAQILKHLLAEVKRVYHREIRDAIITVPANFDVAMCQATVEAARLAGIAVRHKDNRKRQVLLSEPNAVMYDLLNQMQKGEIPAHLLDTSKPQKVLVFDIGGGTLDITLHRISRNDKNEELLQMDEIATNRYTRLGGDDFDVLLAKEMYRRYCNQYRRTPSIVQKIEAEKEEVMAQLERYAENLKIDINDQVTSTQDDTWGDEVIESPIGGGMHNGYAYDDTFTKEQFEKIIAPLLGHHLQYQDYKRFDTIRDEASINTIMYPILDVLQKASHKLQVDTVVVDAVVLNGGMSKLYLIQKRLKTFFGFDPIVALDPDQAVARGAAVYHYYLHKYGEADLGLPVNLRSAAPSGIQLRSTVLNEALYLGTKGGVHELLVDAGSELPFVSENIDGFSIEPHQNKIKIPIRKKDTSGEYTTIASGEMSFKKSYKNGTAISIQFTLSRNKILSFRASTGLEEGITTISIAKGGTVASRHLIAPKQGASLIPGNEINKLSALCRQKRKGGGEDIHKRIKVCIQTILSCSNPADFAQVILTKMNKEQQQKRDEFFVQRLLVLSRKFARRWKPAYRHALVQQCITIASAINHNFLPVSGDQVATINEAIRNIGLFGDPKQLEALRTFHDKGMRYEDPLIYAHAVSQTGVEWIYTRLDAASLRSSLWGIGVALQRNAKAPGSLDLQEVVNKILDIMDQHTLNSNNRESALISLGLICDQRESAIDPVSRDFAHTVQERIQEIMIYYETSKQLTVALHLIKGELLSEEDEGFLLQKISNIEEDEA